MKILTAAQMQRVDHLTSSQYGVPSLDLMENAGTGVVALLEERYGPLDRKKIAIICGRGNNGGDGLVVARLLRTKGLAPQVLLLAEPSALRGDAAINYERLAASGAPKIVPDLAAWKRVKPELEDATLIIDAILGTGLSKPLQGFLLEVVSDLNRRDAERVAVDLPTGMAADTGELIGDFLRADATVTFTAPKYAHVFPPACEHVGDWNVRDIGTPAEALDNDPELFLSLTGREDFAWLAEPRKLDSHKGMYGHVLLLAGSVGKTGAAVLAAKTALRAGAGLVTIAAPTSALPVIASLGVEYMTEPLPETAEGAITMSAALIERMNALVKGISVLGIGPGLGNSSQTQDAARAVIHRYRLPMVIDADALNAFAGNMDQLETAGGRVRVLTPHPGEMSRLTGLATAEIQKRRVEVAREFAIRRNVHLVLKGARTLVAAPDGRVAVNPTGNPGMATGGSGDCLTGLVASFLAQHPSRDVAEVVSAAVYVHGLAGDFAASAKGQLSLIAGDLVDFLPQAIRSLGAGAALGPPIRHEQV